MTLRPVYPEDVLPDGSEFAVFGGRKIRMGTVAAFIANVQALREATPGTERHTDLWSTIVDLAPQLSAVGLFEVFWPRDPLIAELVETLSRATDSESVS
ncbi:hypothetical protein CH279_01100 [Rhodococcus sp. 06-412-2B]|nr:hypothetical protein CH279_01100 [Rhodococcus sp. 06-412-2B]